MDHYLLDIHWLKKAFGGDKILNFNRNEPQSMGWEFRELTTSPKVLMCGIDKKFCPLHRSQVSSVRMMDLS